MANPTDRTELDSCGIGFVADLHARPSRDILDRSLEGLRRMKHRGAVAADRKTGDGAGVLLPIAPALVPGPWCGLAMVFLRDDAARAGIERSRLASVTLRRGWAGAGRQGAQALRARGAGHAVARARARHRAAAAQERGE